MSPTTPAPRLTKANGPTWQVVATGAISLILLLMVALGTFWTSQIEANEIAIEENETVLDKHDTAIAVIQTDVAYIRSGVTKLLNP